MFLLLAGVLWVAFVHWHYRIRSTPPRRLFTETSDGWALALHHRPGAPRRFLEPVILAHGLSSSHRSFEFDPPQSLAHHLAAAGFECFSIDFRGAGFSRRVRRGSGAISVDAFIQQDAPALVSRALEVARAPRAFWLGHSLGGMAGYGFAVTGGESRLAGLCALGAPVFFPFEPWMHWGLKLLLALGWPRALHQRALTTLFAPFLGRVDLPLSDTVINPKAIPPPLQRKLFANVIGCIPYGVLRQLSDWISADAFRSLDGRIDYRAGFSRLRLPVLVLGGRADRLARPAALKGQLALLGSEDKETRCLGCAEGMALDYGHGDLLFGGAAHTEVYPLISEWLSARATPLENGRI